MFKFHFDLMMYGQKLIFITGVLHLQNPDLALFTIPKGFRASDVAEAEDNIQSLPVIQFVFKLFLPSNAYTVVVVPFCLQVEK